MDLNANKELVRLFWRAMWTPDPAAALTPLVTPDLAFRGTLGIRVRGPEGVAEYVRAVLRAFPDYHAEIEEMVAEGDRVAARMHFTGTHLGEALGCPPTGRKTEYAGVALARVEQGRIREMWVVGDTLGLLEQLKGA
jgi:steroid delta-isomerase-like uncharacterized protein